MIFFYYNNIKKPKERGLWTPHSKYNRRHYSQFSRIKAWMSLWVGCSRPWFIWLFRVNILGSSTSWYFNSKNRTSSSTGGRRSFYWWSSTRRLIILWLWGEGNISHVTTFVGGTSMIHAPQEGEVVKYADMTSGYWTERFITARRLW